MRYIFQWKNGDEKTVKMLKDQQGYFGFKVVDTKIGEIEGIKLLQATIEWFGDHTLRPHPLFKEMTKCGGEIHGYKQD